MTQTSQTINVVVWLNIVTTYNTFVNMSESFHLKNMKLNMQNKIWCNN